MSRTISTRRAKLVKIDFDQFKVRNQNPRGAFESFSYFLFCRRFNVSNGLFRYKNQTGLETEPIKDGRNVIGFQAKFFESTIDKDQLIDSLKKAKNKHAKLNKLIFYVNKEFSESRNKTTSVPQNKQAVENEASTLGVNIEWVVPSNLEILLNKPSNFDLAQFYFGQADSLGFIRGEANYKIQTFIQSDEYLKLPLLCDDKIVKNPASSILKRAQKSFLIVGHPGSGKSIFIHFLFREFGGLNKSTEDQMIQLLVRNGAVPMIINLKDCANESLESLIRSRQNDSNVKGNNLGFIYLLDGLDELGEEKADQVLSFVKELEQKEDTKRIIISCRSGNLNRAKARIYLPQFIEFQFRDLNIDCLNGFFSAKKDPTKIKALGKLKKSNPKILNEIKDILLIRLLWETIEKLNAKSTVADLMEQKVNLLLSDPDHKKNIESLNLLDAKSDQLISLNQEISFNFQQKFQYRFTRKELQKIIQDKFSRIDYRAVNEIINYLSTLFFESNYLDDDPSPGFIYQHRRYLEFFFTQKLKIEYEKDPTVLRRLDILSNQDYFENYFLPYVRKEYEKKENIVGLIDLNLIDVYLGNHKGFGIDDAYYLNSSEFIPALANQNRYFIDELFESENFQIKNILFVDIPKLKSKFEEWNKDKNNYRVNDYLASIWRSGVSSLLEHIVIFWKANKKEIAQGLLANLSEVTVLYKKNRYLEQLDQDRKPEDPYWRQWESYLFILICIRGNKIANIFRDLIRRNYSNFEENKDNFAAKDEGKNKLVKSFFRVVLEFSSDDLFSQTASFDDFELVAFLEVLSTKQFLRLFIANKGLQKSIKSLLETKNIVATEESSCLFFYKKFLGIQFNENEKKLMEDLYTKLRNERKVDWSFHDVAVKFAFISFALNKNRFVDLSPDPSDRIRYYDELGLYSALFSAFVEILNKKITIGEIIRDYFIYVTNHDDRLGHYLKVDTSFLWANIFSAAENVAHNTLATLKQKLLQEGSNVVPYSFFYHLSTVNKKLFDKITNESDLIHFEETLHKADDYQSLVNECFAISTFYSTPNEQKSRTYFIRGLKESILRHGWRKDTLVSYQLVNALEILWRNNWDTRENLIKLTTEVFNLTLRVGEFTDGKGTWQGPYNAIDLAAKYEIALAEVLKKKLISEKGHSNFSNMAVTSVLLGKINLGISIEEIMEGIKDFRKDYDYEGKPNSDIYEQSIKVYIAIAESDLYTEEQRGQAFEKAYGLVEEMKREKISYYLSDTYFKDIKIRYLSLCKKYKKDSNVKLEEKTNEYQPPSRMPEKDLLKMISKLNTKPKVSGFYKRLENYNNGMVISSDKTWRSLIEKTYKILGNIKPFIQLLERYSFPHTDFFTANSEYFYIGLAIAISDINMKPEAIKYLYRNTGHGGFVNMMKTYELIGEKEMCKKLFTRYLQLCHLLSD